MAHTCNISTQEAEAGESLPVQIQLGIHGQTLSRKVGDPPISPNPMKSDGLLRMSNRSVDPLSHGLWACVRLVHVGSV